jgi:hypothetical protein
MIKKTVLAILFLSGMNFQLSAQNYDATSLSLAGAYGGMVRGVDALSWNPANLGLPRDHWIEINFIGVNMWLANSGFSFNDYERYLTASGHNGEWTTQDTREIYNIIPESGLRLNADFNANALGLVIDNYGFSVQMIGRVRSLIPKEPFELILKGNIRDEYQFDDINGGLFTALKTTISGSYPFRIRRYFDTFSVGLSFNYYVGLPLLDYQVGLPLGPGREDHPLAMAEIIDSEGAFYTGKESIHSNASVRIRTAGGGSGFGIDIGAAGVIGKKLTLSLGLQNVIGSINWNKNTEEHFYKLVIDSAEFKDAENLDPATEDTSIAISDFATRLPFVLHLGAAYLLTDELTLSLDLEQALDNTMGYSDQGQLAVGAQYYALPFLPLRGGLSFGGKWDFTTAVGFGLHFGVFQFDIGYLMHRALWPTLSNGFSTAMDMKFVF